MKIKPVDNIPQPEYPEKYAAEIKPLIAEARPRRWAKTPLALSLSALIALGLSGCADPDNVSKGKDTLPAGYIIRKPANTNADNVDYVIMGDLPAPYYYNTFIPLFEFGGGTGSIGCVSVSAPSFMSEEEAFAIISSAFAEAGLVLARDAAILPNANIPVTNISPSEKKELETKVGELDTDLLQLNITSLPVVFVSQMDVAGWKAAPSNSSVDTFNMKETAKALSQNNPYLVVFYDPCAKSDFNGYFGNLERLFGESDDDYYKRYDEAREAAQEAARLESERLLREQVAAFLAWMQNEGIY